MIAYILCLFYFCQTWEFYVLWVTYDHLYYVTWLACLVFFPSMASTVCNVTSYSKVLQLSLSHCGDNWKGILFSWLHLYYVICISYFCDIWEHCVFCITYDHLYYAFWLACWAICGSLTQVHDRTLCAYIYIYIYIYKFGKYNIT